MAVAPGCACEGTHGKSPNGAERGTPMARLCSKTPHRTQRSCRSTRRLHRRCPASISCRVHFGMETYEFVRMGFTHHYPSCRPIPRCAATATKQIGRRVPATTAWSGGTCKSIAPCSWQHLARTRDRRLFRHPEQGISQKTWRARSGAQSGRRFGHQSV